MNTSIEELNKYNNVVNVRKLLLCIGIIYVLDFFFFLSLIFKNTEVTETNFESTNNKLVYNLYM